MDSIRENLQREIQYLKKILSQKEKQLNNLDKSPQKVCEETNIYIDYKNLTKLDISRYSRQMILPSFGIDGQCKLKQGRVLIVGVGGLGCPAALYLAAAGIGSISILDSDTVEITNLHRQILHGETNINKPKVLSGYESLLKINSTIKINPIMMHANGQTLEKLFSEEKFDVVVDCTDNVATRYLLNDICVFNQVPLVSGSALQLEGQLTVYNYENGLCYRCLFPVPPPPDTVTSCGDGGVLGAVPGVIGVLQALEVIKILLNSPGVLSGRLLLFDGSDSTFRNVKLRQKNPKCAVCSENPVITKPIDYEQFCGSKAEDKVTDIAILNPSEEIDVKDLVLSDKNVVIDVRPKIEFQICRLPNSFNYPYSDLVKGKNLEEIKQILSSVTDNDKVYILCRRGNDSQRSINILKEAFQELNVKLFNVKGGLRAYSKFVDPLFPEY